MTDQLPPEPMGDAFKARMRQGLSAMAVRERLRERRRNRAIAGGALAAVVVATVAVIGAQALTSVQLERDLAGPGTTEAPSPTDAATATPTPTPAVEPPSATPTVPVETPAQTGPPPGLEGVAAGVPEVLDVLSCPGGCGDTGAGGGSQIERRFDIYLVCEGRGQVRYGGQEWIDCADHPAGSGFVQLDAADTYEDGDPQLTTSDDFDGALSVVDSGGVPVGARPAERATVYVTCLVVEGAVTVGGVVFDCAAPQAPEGEFVQQSTMAAWGVPILAGEIAPRIERTSTSAVRVAFVVER